ncbi:Conidiation protein 6-domain-containing protein [Mycena capillaripes]|nr:Conidiation protein 6-domain-containing protein [Mycena capillaripes]
MSSESTTKNHNQKVAGLKSALAREDVSDQAKMNAQERLEEMGALTTDAPDSTNNKEKHAREILEAAGYTVTKHGDDVEHQVRVLAGYKAALHNPRVSAEAKAHAREYLKEHDAL